MRRYAELISVEPGEGNAPVRFRWRGRSYVVRVVLARWLEVGIWWRSSDPVHDHLDRDREVWRVEAVRPSRAGVVEGVFDLRHDVRAGTWTLAHALD